MVTSSAPRFHLSALAALLAAFASAQPGQATCDPSTDPDRSDIANARASVAANCDCAAATNHGYVSCAAQQADAVLSNKSCARFVKKCASHSTCGRPGFVTCCRTNSKGVTRCSIKSSSSRCVAPRGGSRCIDQLASCCDACPAGGCTQTTTIPSTTTTSRPPVCGNGLVEPPEQCDGQAFCTSDCRLPIYACCDIAVNGGVCSRDFVPEPGPPFCTDGSTTHIGSHPAGGPPCPAAGFQYGEGPCADVTRFAPTVFCCQLNPCSQTVLSDTGSLVSWLLNNCEYPAGVHPAVVGTCGSDFQCHPG